MTWIPGQEDVPVRALREVYAGNQMIRIEVGGTCADLTRDEALGLLRELASALGIEDEPQ